MSTLAESLKRLYHSNRVTLAKLDSMLLATRLTQQEYDYIIAP